MPLPVPCEAPRLSSERRGGDPESRVEEPRMQSGWFFARAKAIRSQGSYSASAPSATGVRSAFMFSAIISSAI